VNDSVPLDWKDEFVYHTGVEYQVIKSLALRAGYYYSPSPVPAGTLTPLTAAIFEHTLSAGLGWHCGSCAIDLAYEYDLPVTETVGTSALLDGEYSNSKVRVSAQWLALTFTKRF
jgi:long-chain fatty acid transport protein